MKKNKIYEETKCTNFRELVSSCSARFGNRTAFTVKKKNKELHNISFIDFENIAPISLNTIIKNMILLYDYNQLNFLKN